MGQTPPKRPLDEIMTGTAGPGAADSQGRRLMGRGIDWLQSHVQPKLDELVQRIGPPDRSVFDKRDPVTELFGPVGDTARSVAAGAVNTIAHPVENAEMLAPLALEAARFIPQLRGPMAAVSIARRIPQTAGRGINALRDVLMGTERATAGGAAGAAITASDRGEPLGPAAQKGALRQGGANLAIGGTLALGGAASRGFGRHLGYKALDISDRDLPNVWLKEGMPVDEFSPGAAKKLIKDVMVNRGEGSIGGDSYFRGMREKAIGQRGARRATLDLTQGPHPDTGELLPDGNFAVNYADVTGDLPSLAGRLSGPQGAFAPGAARDEVERAGRSFWAGREGVGLQEQGAVDQAQDALRQYLGAPTPRRAGWAPPTGPADAMKVKLLDAINIAEGKAQSAHEARFLPGTAPPRAGTPVGLTDAAAALREMDKELLAARQQFLTKTGGATEYVPSPSEQAQMQMRSALSDAVKAKAPMVEWQGQAIPYDKFMEEMSRTIVWRDIAKRATGTGDSAMRVRGGMTMTGRPFVNVGEGFSRFGGAVARPMIVGGEKAMSIAGVSPELARLVATIIGNQPKKYDWEK